MGVRYRTGGRHQRSLAAGAVAAFACLAAAPTAGAAFTPCPGQSGVECMTVTVPLDRSGGVPGAVNLAARRVPAASGQSAGTVLFVAGGPGQAATPGLATLAAEFRVALPNYDLLTFDQRGTGLSGPLRCAAFDSPRRESDTRAGARCGNEVGAARGFYRTTESVDDVEAVRQAAGIGAMSVFAVSYGGRVAGEYVRRYPGTVTRLLLDSPTTPFGTDPLDLQRVGTLPRLLRTLCARRSCPFTRSVNRDLTRLAARLRRRPLRARVVNPRGRSRKVRVSLSDLYGITISSDLAPSQRSQLPSAYSSAVRGDGAPLARLLASPAFQGSAAQGKVERLSFVTNAVTLCSESPFPWNPASAPDKGRDAALSERINQLGPRAFAPFGPGVVVGLGTVTPTCLRWPPVTPPPVASGPAPAVPTLVLSGLEDLRTPVERSREVAAGYPAGRLLEIPYAGHSTIGTDPSSCAAFAGYSFLAGGEALGACPAQPRLIPIAPRAPLTLRRLRPLGPRGVRGRTLRATTRTIDDSLAQVIDGSGSLRAGGLRGGRLVFTAAKSRIRLRGYEYLPDVKVSGSLKVTQGPRLSGKLRVRGGGTTRAVVRVSSNGEVRARFAGAAGASASAVTRVAPFRLVRVPRAQAVGP